MFLSVGCRKKPNAIITTLHKAAEEGNIERVKLLIAGGADVNAMSKFGDTPLHRSAEFGKKMLLNF